MPQPLLALVDSGASTSSIDKLAAEMLGFSFENKPHDGGGSGVGGPYRFWQLPDLEFSISNHTYSFPFKVIDNPNLWWPSILGEDTIFKVAQVTIRRYEESFDLSFRADIN